MRRWNLRIVPAGNIDLARFDFSNPTPLMTVLPSGMLPLRMAIVSGFKIRVAVLHDSEPLVPCKRDVEMTRCANWSNGRCQIARATPISRQFYHGISLFRHTTIENPTLIGCLVSLEECIKRMRIIAIYYSSLRIAILFLLNFYLFFLHLLTLNLLSETNVIKNTISHLNFMISFS